RPRGRSSRPWIATHGDRPGTELLFVAPRSRERINAQYPRPGRGRPDGEGGDSENPSFGLARIVARRQGAGFEPLARALIQAAGPGVSRSASPRSKTGDPSGRIDRADQPSL